MLKSNRLAIDAVRRRAVLVSLAVAAAVSGMRSLAAQQRDVTANDVWAGVTGDVRIAPRALITFTSEQRRSSGLMVPRQLFVLAGLMADLGRGVRFGGGYSGWHTSPNDDFGPARATREHRAWQQLTGLHGALGAAVFHRLRYEQRWFAPVAASGEGRDYSYAARVRHQVRVVAPLDGRRAAATRLYAMPNVELFVRTTNHEGVFIDQSRLGAALGFGVTPRLNLEAGYLRQGVVLGGGSLEVHHVIQLTARVLTPRRPER